MFLPRKTLMHKLESLLPFRRNNLETSFYFDYLMALLQVLVYNMCKLVVLYETVCLRVRIHSFIFVESDGTFPANKA